MGASPGFDPANKRRYLAIPILRAKSTTPVSETQVENYLLSLANSTCAGESDGMIAGVPVLKKHVEDFDPAEGKTITITTWRAPSLGCRILRQILVASGGVDADSRHELDTLSIRLGEPDSSLMEYPADYAERPPSSHQEELARLEGKTISERLKDTGNRADARYRAARETLGWK